MADSEIVAKILNSDPEKGAELFCMEYYNTMKYAIGSVNRKGSTLLEEEDLIHEIFIYFMKKDMKIIRDFKGIRNCSFCGYVFTISRRQAIKIVEKEKKKNRSGSLDIDLLPAKLITDCEIIKKDDIRHLSKLLDKLPVNDQLFIIYIYKYEMNTEDIMEIFNLKNRDAVYKKRHRILKKLRGEQ
ncbi:MAG: sigma-70 family RNA polymerase sigma factor [Chitinispirillia bacterium]|jgi:RNA polymerase sigma factor (sigma-70 family)